MIANRKNRIKYGALECNYGCCRTLTGPKAKVRRIIRTREKRAWKVEAGR